MSTTPAFIFPPPPPPPPRASIPEQSPQNAYQPHGQASGYGSQQQLNGIGSRGGRGGGRRGYRGGGYQQRTWQNGPNLGQRSHLQSGQFSQSPPGQFQVGANNMNGFANSFQASQPGPHYQPAVGAHSHMGHASFLHSAGPAQLHGNSCSPYVPSFSVPSTQSQASAPTFHSYSNDYPHGSGISSQIWAAADPLFTTGHPSPMAPPMQVGRDEEHPLNKYRFPNTSIPVSKFHGSLAPTIIRMCSTLTIVFLSIVIRLFTHDHLRLTNRMQNL